MNDEKFIKDIWYFLINNIFEGKIAIVISTTLIIFAVFLFIRWKVYALSILLLIMAMTVAYLGGFLKLLKGGVF